MFLDVFENFMWWSQSYVAQGLMVADMLAEMLFDGLESMGSWTSLPLQPSEKLHELPIPSKVHGTMRNMKLTCAYVADDRGLILEFINSP